jgi:hypothetical protein
VNTEDKLRNVASHFAAQISWWKPRTGLEGRDRFLGRRKTYTGESEINDGDLVIGGDRVSIQMQMYGFGCVANHYVVNLNVPMIETDLTLEMMEDIGDLTENLQKGS